MDPYDLPAIPGVRERLFNRVRRIMMKWHPLAAVWPHCNEFIAKLSHKDVAELSKLDDEDLEDAVLDACA